MREELKKEQNGSDTASTGCGMFDFLKKKQHDNHVSCEEYSSEEEGRSGEKRKRKGLTEKIKEKISGKKEREGDENTEVITNRVGAEETHSETGIMDKLKGKLPGLGQRKKAGEDGSFPSHCQEDDIKEKKGIVDKIKEKMSVGRNVEQRKPKENLNVV